MSGSSKAELKLELKTPIGQSKMPSSTLNHFFFNKSSPTLSNLGKLW